MTPALLEVEQPHAHAAPPVLEIDERRGTFGISLFIASEAMLFAILFAAYYYLGPDTNRWGIEHPPKLHYAIPQLVILLVSSGIIYGGEEWVKKGELFKARIALLVTLLFGLAFLTLSYFDYAERLRELFPQTDSYGSITYTIVSLHVAHLTLGMLMLVFVLFTPHWHSSERIPHKPYHNAAMYWHFVDVVWVFVVSVIYIYPNLVH